MTLLVHEGRIPARRGFSLVELLVAMAVLALLMVMLTKLADLTSKTISANSRKLEAVGQARLVWFFGVYSGKRSSFPQKNRMRMR
ncbi:MAG: PulJ/GspJ family protein [Terrimicrobiaceae bacterium]